MEEVATEADEAVVVVATLLPTLHHLVDPDGRQSFSQYGVGKHCFFYELIPHRFEGITIFEEFGKKA